MKKGDLVRWWSDTNGLCDGFGIVIGNDRGYIRVVWVTKEITEVSLLAESSLRVISESI